MRAQFGGERAHLRGRDDMPLACRSRAARGLSPPAPPSRSEYLPTGSGCDGGHARRRRRTRRATVPRRPRPRSGSGASARPTSGSSWSRATRASLPTLQGALPTRAFKRQPTMPLGRRGRLCVEPRRWRTSRAGRTHACSARRLQLETASGVPHEVYRDGRFHARARGGAAAAGGRGC